MAEEGHGTPCPYVPAFRVDHTPAIAARACRAQLVRPTRMPRRAHVDPMTQRVIE